MFMPTVLSISLLLLTAGSVCGIVVYRRISVRLERAENDWRLVETPIIDLYTLLPTLAGLLLKAAEPEDTRKKEAAALLEEVCDICVCAVTPDEYLAALACANERFTAIFSQYFPDIAKPAALPPADTLASLHPAEALLYRHAAILSTLYAAGQQYNQSASTYNATVQTGIGRLAARLFLFPLLPRCTFDKD